MGSGSSTAMPKTVPIAQAAAPPNSAPRMALATPPKAQNRSEDKLLHFYLPIGKVK
jgi:hypothetical protein